MKHFADRPRTTGTAHRTICVAIGTAGPSLASMLLTIAIARQTHIHDFASFALAGLLYALASGLTRAAFVENTIVALGEPIVAVRQVHRLVLTSLGLAVGIGAAGMFASSPYLLLLALGTPGLCLLDHARALHMAVLDARRGLMLSLVWCLPVATVSGISLLTNIPPMLLFGTWVGWGASIGFVATLSDGLSIRPMWPRGPLSELRNSGLFTLDFAVGSGGASASTLLLGSLIGTTAIGALRAASTLLGPIAIISTSARSLILPYLVRSQVSHSDVRAACQATTVLVAFTLPVLVALSLLPQDIGEQLLGRSFSVARPLLPPLAVEVLAALIGSVAAAGHRSRAAGGRSLIVRLALGLPRPLIICLTAIAYGLLAAAWSMAAISVISALAWWISFMTLNRDQIDTR